jgi:hypothetical protein
MTLRVSLEIAKSVGICNEVMPAIIKYYTDNNLESATLDEVIAHWKALGKREWAIWLYSKRTLFETLTRTTSSPEEIAFYEADEAYLRQEQIFTYVVNNVEYEVLEQANVARQRELDLLRDKVEPLVVCALETLHENGDATWQVIDLDDFVPPTDTPYKIRVFNPAIGTYNVCDSLEEAISQRNSNMIQVADVQFSTAVISVIRKHVDFPEEPVQNKHVL